MDRPAEFEIAVFSLPVPPALSAVSVLDDHVALLARLRDLTRALDEERGLRAAAEDAACLTVVDAFRASGDSPGDAWEALGIELVSATGSRLCDLPPGRFEVLTTREPAPGAPEEVVIETWQPAVLRRGRLLRSGQVVVARRPLEEEEANQ